METLVKIWQTSQGRAVSARELHELINSKKHFASWIRERIETYGFVENKDYQVIKGEVEFFPTEGKSNKIGRPRIEYALTISMAKELAMIENNEVGRKVRNYLIKMEEEYQQLLLNKSLSPDEIKLELEKSKVAKLAELNKAAQETKDQVKKELLVDLVIKECTGEFHSEIPKPISKRTTYRPKEIVVLMKDRYGIELSPYQIGILSNQFNLKTSDFGEFITTTDKNGKVIGSLFNYYESVLEKLKGLVEIHGKPKTNK